MFKDCLSFYFLLNSGRDIRKQYRMKVKRAARRLMSKYVHAEFPPTPANSGHIQIVFGWHEKLDDAMMYASLSSRRRRELGEQFRSRLSMANQIECPAIASPNLRSFPSSSSAIEMRRPKIWASFFSRWKARTDITRQRCFVRLIGQTAGSDWGHLDLDFEKTKTKKTVSTFFHSFSFKDRYPRFKIQKGRNTTTHE